MNDNHCQGCGVSEGSRHLGPCIDPEFNIATKMVAVDEEDVKALVDHYRVRVAAWGKRNETTGVMEIVNPGDGPMLTHAIEQLDYWLDVQGRMR